MEMVAWLAGEAHSDGPDCTCPVIAALVRACNDALPSDAARELHLRPLVPLLVHTRGTADDEARRGFAIADHTLRVLLPLALQERGRVAEADAVRALPEVVDTATARGASLATRALGPAAHTTTWLLARAADGRPAASYAAAAARVAREAGTAQAFAAVAQLLRELVTPRVVARERKPLVATA
jgi:hypothetical protein